MSRSSISPSRLLLNTAGQDRSNRASSLLFLVLGVTAGVALVLSLSRGRAQRTRQRRASERVFGASRVRPFPLLDGAPRPPVPVRPTDALGELEARVLEVFCHDPILRERAIDIGALEGGVVELTGWVEAPTEVAHAMTITRGVPGVAQVIDHLAVRGREAPRNHSSGNYAAVREDPLDEREPLSPPRAD